MFFQRDQNGRVEVDCIIDRGDTLIPVEIKSGETVGPGFFTGLAEWNKISGANPDSRTIIYGGNTAQTRSGGKVVGWEKASQFISTLYSSSSNF